MSTVWRRLKRLVSEAADLPDEERASYLRQACPDDEELRREAVALLELDAPAEALFAESPMQEASPESPTLSDERLGAYRLESRLGTGGMGDVYLGRRADGAFEHEVAVKILRVSKLPAEYLDRFRAERQLLAELDHPNIARLLDGGTTTDGRPYLVMDYVEGTRIDLFCASRDLSLEGRLRLFLRVCEAVQHAHRHLIVHRDLKPANILVTEEGDPKLLDFGIAKDLGNRELTPATRLFVPLTPEYASPEQLQGGAVTTAVDVYALGVILCELLTGQRPFRQEGNRLITPSTRLARSQSRQGWWQGQRLRGDLDHVVQRAIAPLPADRYPSVDELARDLRRHLEGKPLEGRGGTFYRFGKWTRRRWKPLAAVVLVLALAAGLWGERLQRRQSEQETDRVSRLSDELGQYLVDLFTEADPSASGERSAALGAFLDQGAALLAEDAFAEEPLMRASLLGAVGRVYRRQGRLEEAEPLLRESLELRRETLAPDHPLIGLSSNNLALLLRAREQYPEALQLLEEALRIQRLHEPDDDPWTAAMLNNLAGVEMKLGRFDESVAHFREAVEMKRRLYGDSEPEILAKALKNLGVGLMEGGRSSEAEQVFRTALAELGRAEPADPLVRAGVEHHLGSLLRQRGEVDGARSLLQASLEERIRTLGSSDPKVIETQAELLLIPQERVSSE